MSLSHTGARSQGSKECCKDVQTQQETQPVDLVPSAIDGCVVLEPLCRVAAITVVQRA